jgi:hypothetical protein
MALDLGHLPAYRAMGDVQCLSGPRKAPVRDRGIESPERIERWESHTSTFLVSGGGGMN